MKRALVILGLAFAAGAGAYAQSVFVQEQPSSEPVQKGVAYIASFCTTPAVPSVGVSGTFYMRVTRELNRGWVEVDYAGYPGALEPNPSRKPDTARFNLNSICFVKPITP